MEEDILIIFLEQVESEARTPTLVKCAWPRAILFIETEIFNLQISGFGVPLLEAWKST